MSNETIPIIRREVAQYRLWIKNTSDVETLRQVALSTCDDLEAAIWALEQLALEGHEKTDVARYGFDRRPDERAQ
jgi:hypothetical protein